MKLHNGMDVPDSLPYLQTGFKAPGLNVSDVKVFSTRLALVYGGTVSLT